MIRKAGDFSSQRMEKFKGGEGYFAIENILEGDEFDGKGRLFAKGKLEPGHSVGWHVHEGDMEVCYFLSGHGVVYEEDGRCQEVRAGDANIVLDGHGHKIVNTAEEPLVYIALVLYTR